MLRLRKSKSNDAEFCDRCGSVCDSGCRARALRQRNLTRALEHRIGL